tara:strand:- start:68992 stop:70578 length:1587 start_codon:yes stop_codon:yes gene_type:complete
MSDSTIDLLLELDDDESIEALTRRAARKRGISAKRLGPIEILKRSIDARRGRVRIRYLLREKQDEAPALGGAPLVPCSDGRRVVIVGAGPAGLFCAYQLAREGIRSIILERGKKVQPRRRDLKGLTKGGVVDADSNYCFGEGGAGTYSDGKLYTRAHKRGDVRDVIEVLVKAGAPEEILTDARPHIGSNKLPKVVTSLREQLEEVGVEFRFGAKVVALEASGGRVTGVALADGARIGGDAVVMATGHSARDVYTILGEAGAAMEAKGFALGVRIEHPQPSINRIQYGNAAGHPKLPAASYRLVQEVRGRGVFSFCMCPGGWIVPASTETGGLVVNGMSLSKRDSPYANSGMVVGLEPSDWQSAPGLDGVFGGVELQRRIEEAAWQGGGGGLVAPAVRLRDFLSGEQSSDLPPTSYVPGLKPANIDEILESGGIPIAGRLREAFGVFGSKLRGFVADEAVLVGVESRTSAPVRVLRDRESLQSPSLTALYPCGEGAGYAGGIVSAAMDGVRVARAITAVYETKPHANAS